MRRGQVEKSISCYLWKPFSRLRSLSPFAWFVIVTSGTITIGSYFIIAGTFDTTFFGFVQGHTEKIANPLDHRENMTIVVNLHSPAFAADSRITPVVSLKPDYSYRNKNNITSPLPATYTVEFSEAHCDAFDKYLEPLSPCRFELEYNPATQRYEHILMEKKMYYTYSGLFDVSLFATDRDDIQPTSVGHDFLEITNVESTLTFRIFKATFVLGGIGIIVALITLYETRKAGNGSVRQGCSS